MRLAWHFGFFDVDTFAAGASARQVSEWMAFLQVEPDIGTRIDVMTGQVSASNLWPHQKKGAKSKPKDLMPKYGQKRKRVTGLSLLAWATQNGAKVDEALAAKLIKEK
ncbi:MAG: hypothetical protein AAF561_00140 [Planctomycetota bacterium]